MPRDLVLRTCVDGACSTLGVCKVKSYTLLTLVSKFPSMFTPLRAVWGRRPLQGASAAPVHRAPRLWGQLLEERRARHIAYGLPSWASDSSSVDS